MNLYNIPERAADAVSVRSLSNSPLTSLRSLRALAAAEIERLIALVDAIDDDPDFEPSLGYTDEEAETRGYAASDDREIEDEHDEDTHDQEAVCEDEGGDVVDEPHDDDQLSGPDSEPSLGSLEGLRFHQEYWGWGTRNDAEMEHDGREPDDEDAWLSCGFAIDQTIPNVGARNA